MGNIRGSFRYCQSCIEWATSARRMAQTAIEKMWTKLRKYYDKTDKPFAYVDATLLHPGLKKKFIKKAGYSADTIETYIKKAEMRFKNEYDVTQRVPHGCQPTL